MLTGLNGDLSEQNAWLWPLTHLASSAGWPYSSSWRQAQSGQAKPNMMHCGVRCAAVEAETASGLEDTPADDDGYSTDRSEASADAPAHDPMGPTDSVDDLAFDADTRAAIAASLRDLAAATAQVRAAFYELGAQLQPGSWALSTRMHACSCSEPFTWHPIIKQIALCRCILCLVSGPQLLMLMARLSRRVRQIQQKQRSARRRRAANSATRRAR